MHRQDQGNSNKHVLVVVDRGLAAVVQDTVPVDLRVEILDLDNVRQFGRRYTRTLSEKAKQYVAAANGF